MQRYGRRAVRPSQPDMFNACNIRPYECILTAEISMLPIIDPIYGAAMISKENYNGLFDFIKQLQYSRPTRVFDDAFLYSDRPRIRRLAAKWVELGLK